MPDAARVLADVVEIGTAGHHETVLSCSFPEDRRLRRVMRRIEDFQPGEAVFDQLVDDRLVLQPARDGRGPEAAALADDVDRLLRA